jgi:hypothetical protein
MHSHGETKKTSGAAAATQRKTTATVSIARVICACSYHFVVALWTAQRAESAGEILGAGCRQTQQSRFHLEAFLSLE